MNFPCAFWNIYFQIFVFSCLKIVSSLRIFFCLRAYTPHPTSISHSVHRFVKMFSKMRSLKLFVSLIVFIGLFDIFGKCNGELTPPYFNLAEGRKISASATCGVGIDGPELYCKLVGANTEHEEHLYEVIQGQVSLNVFFYE